MKSVPTIAAAAVIAATLAACGANSKPIAPRSGEAQRRIGPRLFFFLL